VYYWGGISPGNGYGNLTNVAKGPLNTPSSPPAWGGVRITPNFPDNFIRLKSFDIASLDDNSGDEVTAIAVYDPVTSTTYFFQQNILVAGDSTNTAHTHFNFGGSPIEIPADHSLALIWHANNGQVAVDNVQFEVVGPRLSPATEADFYTVAQGGTLIVPAPGVLENDSPGEGAGPMTVSLLNGANHLYFDELRRDGWISLQSQRHCE
jgi:hypothetical protein